MRAHPAVIAGWVLVACALALYLGVILTAWMRVGRQYSRAMAGSGSLRVAAILAAIGRYWYLLLLLIGGVALVLVGR